MPDTSRNRILFERIGLFFLGAIALFLGSALSLGLWTLFAALALAAIVAGLVEVAAVRRDGRRHWIGSWLPSALGMMTLAAVVLATEEKGPDSGLALSIIVAGFAIGIPVFALVVNLVATIALRLTREPAGVQ